GDIDPSKLDRIFDRTVYFPSSLARKVMGRMFSGARTTGRGLPINKYTASGDTPSSTYFKPLISRRTPQMVKEFANNDDAHRAFTLPMLVYSTVTLLARLRG